MSVFTHTPLKRVRRNTFNLSHDVKLTGSMGKCIPVMVQECIPGDSFHISSQTLIRFAPLVAPVMHRIRAYMHYFFVPNRIIYDEWEDFISSDLANDVPPSWPYVKGGVSKGSVGDYLGLPITTSLDDGVSVLPLMAYNKVWNEYYRDQNLQSVVTDVCSSGNNSLVSYSQALLPRAWHHDYFTSALPFAQKGPAVNLPLGSTVPVVTQRSTGSATSWSNTNPSGSTTSVPNKNLGSGHTNGNLYADLSQASASTINDFRVALRLQEWFERAARGGTRYFEQLQVHFGIVSPDSRLQRPEFLGGSVADVIISEVLQTSETNPDTGSTPQGTMAGHGILGDHGKRVRYRCVEHGYIIGILSIMPTTAYQQGIPRHFFRQSWEDYAWPTFAHLGEQAILNQELYHDDQDGLNQDTFGYIPRYSEYRYTPSRVAGDFRDTLKFWHLGRIFSNRPVLNDEFIECDPRKDIFAVLSEEEEIDHLWMHVHHKVYAKRPLPKYGAPTL